MHSSFFILHSNKAHIYFTYNKEYVYKVDHKYKEKTIMPKIKTSFKTTNNINKS